MLEDMEKVWWREIIKEEDIYDERILSEAQEEELDNAENTKILLQDDDLNDEYDLESIRMDLLAEYINQDWLWTERILQENAINEMDTIDLGISLYLSEIQTQELNQQEEKPLYLEEDPLVEEKSQIENLKLLLYWKVKRTNWEEIYERIELEKKYEENIYMGKLKTLLKNRFLKMNKYNTDFVNMIEKFISKGKYDQEKEEKIKCTLKKAYDGGRLEYQDVVGIGGRGNGLPNPVLGIARV
jgi:hypothetical protein